MELIQIDGFMLRKMFLYAAKSLENNKEIINALNVYPVPDGDTGTNMSLTMKSAVSGIVENEYEDTDRILETVSKGSLMGARGNSGVILSQIIRGFAKGLDGVKEINTRELSHALKEATDTAYRAVMKPTEGTILTVSRGCSDAAYEVSRTETDIIKFMEKIIDSGINTLERTPDMLPVLKEAGVVDAGGKGYITILEGMLSALKGEEIEILDLGIEKKASNSSLKEEDIEFGYCTEFIINRAKIDSNEFREKIENMGDSTLVIGDDDVIKVHIHTNNPGEVLKRALSYGELIDIKIDNMRYQHRHNNFSDNEINSDDNMNSELLEYGIISVSVGDGINEVFKDFGVDKIISGGQTMNPSTEDILKAIEELNAKNIIILPNNSNIILAASQAKEISDKNVEVIPSKTIQAGISALIAFNSDLNLEENIKNMMAAIENVKTAQITFSVKDTSVNGDKIKKGDIIGLSDKEILCIGENVEDVTLNTIEKIMGEEFDIITLIYGEDVSEDEAEELCQKISEAHPDIDIELVFGGQPLYHYLIAVE
ncbi:MAG: DAK2 domain-containing protein [Andreesenia angusta]|nr:DAK2 domain-containing protein [Andreesenia angusta]